MKFLIILTALAVCATCFAQDDSQLKSARVYGWAGTPVAGTSEVDTLTIQTSTSGGTFALTVAGGRTTAPITWSATNATLIANVDAALEAMPVVGIGGVTTAAGTLSSGIGTITLTFAGKNANMDFPALSVTNNLITGGTTPTVTTTTAGVVATFRDAPTGALVEDYTNGELYQNIGTTLYAPNWQPKGLGFISGAGGAVTQITSRSTGVTLSKRTGQITTTASSLAAQTGVTFTVTNTLVGANDTIVLSKTGGAALTSAWVNTVAAGSFDVTLFNATAATADTTAFVFNFTTIKGANN